MCVCECVSPRETGCVCGVSMANCRRGAQQQPGRPPRGGRALGAEGDAEVRADLPSLGETPLWPGRTTYAVPLPTLYRIC